MKSDVMERIVVKLSELCLLLDWRLWNPAKRVFLVSMSLGKVYLSFEIGLFSFSGRVQQRLDGGVSHVYQIEIKMPALLGNLEYRSSSRAANCALPAVWRRDSDTAGGYWTRSATATEQRCTMDSKRSVPGKAVKSSKVRPSIPSGFFCLKPTYERRWTFRQL